MGGRCYRATHLMKRDNAEQLSQYYGIIRLTMQMNKINLYEIICNG